MRRTRPIEFAHHGALSAVTISSSGSSSTICECWRGKTTAGRIGMSGSPTSRAQRATPSHSELASQLGFVRQRIQPFLPRASNSQTRPRTR